MNRRQFSLSLAAFALAACTRPKAAPKPAAKAGPAPPVGEKLTLSAAEWKTRLTPEQFHVLREQGTERAFTGAYWNEKRAGLYVCAGCGAPLYASADKFKSGTGWPSYTRAVEAGRVVERVDNSHGMARTEIVCGRCGGHLGHVFDDGPAPTGRRHCVNSASLSFQPE